MKAPLFFTGILLSIFVAHADSVDRVPEYFYREGVCKNSSGTAGTNPGYLGECGDLQGQDFTGKDLGNIILRGAVLTGAKFKNARFEGADLTGVQATKSDFSDSSLSQVTAVQADFTDASFVRAKMEKSNFNHARFLRVKMNQVVAPLSHFVGTDFSQANLSRGDFSFSEFANGSLKEADATQTIWRESTLYDMDFSAANLKGAVFVESIFKNVRAAKANFEGAEFSAARMESVLAPDANWRGTYWEDVSVLQSVFSGGIFLNVRARGLKFFASNCLNCNFVGSQLLGVSASGLNLNESRLISVHIQWEQRDEVKLEKALFNLRTEIGMTRDEMLFRSMIAFKSIGVFYNPTYVRTSAKREASNLVLSVNSLQGAGAAEPLNIPIAGFEKLKFSDYSTILFPFMRESPFVKEITPSVRVAFQDYVKNGGTVVFFAGDTAGYGKIPATYRGLFELDFKDDPQNRIINIISKLPTTVGTCFENSLQEVGDANGIWSFQAPNVPPGSQILYADGTRVGIFQNDYGKGRVIYFGILWYEMHPRGRADGGWLSLLGDLLNSVK